MIPVAAAKGPHIDWAAMSPILALAGGGVVILLEARRSGGLRRRAPIALWAMGLLVLALLALLRVWVNLEAWSDVRILMGILGVGNFLFGAGMLVRWLLWRPSRSEPSLPNPSLPTRERGA